jgi:hypothetical protein
VGKDARTNAPDLPDGTSGIFSRGGLDRANQLDFARKIRLSAQRPVGPAGVRRAPIARHGNGPSRGSAGAVVVIVLLEGPNYAGTTLKPGIRSVAISEFFQGNGPSGA